MPDTTTSPARRAAGSKAVTAAVPEARPADASVGQLVSAATADLSTLVRQEVALAKLEMTAAAKKAGIGAGAFGAAGFLLLLVVIFGSIAAAEGIAVALPTWLAFLIIAGGYLLVALMLALFGKIQIGRIEAPERTVATAKDTIAWAKHPTHKPDVTSPQG